MGSILKLLEPRILAALGLSLILLVGVWAGAWRPANARLAEAENALSLAEARLAEARSLVDGTVEEGFNTAEELAEAVKAMEDNTPESVNDLELASIVSAFAVASGLSLTQWDPLPVVRVDGNVSAVPYQFRIQGDLPAISSFLNEIPRELARPATFRNLQISGQGGAAVDFGVSGLVATGTLDIWIFTGNRTVAPSASEEEGPGAGEGAGEPDDQAPPADPDQLEDQEPQDEESTEDEPASEGGSEPEDPEAEEDPGTPAD